MKVSLVTAPFAQTLGVSTAAVGGTHHFSQAILEWRLIQDE
jgi:hypothetical protein